MSTSATRFYSSNVTDFEKMEVSKDNWEEEIKNWRILLVFTG